VGFLLWKKGCLAMHFDLMGELGVLGYNAAKMVWFWG
jgi:hypothetical protein